MPSSFVLMSNKTKEIVQCTINGGVMTAYYKRKKPWFTIDKKDAYVFTNGHHVGTGIYRLKEYANAGNISIVKL